MNIRLLPIVLIAAAGTLVGCKTIDHSAYQPEPQKIVPGTQFQPRIEEDSAYIASVERMARMRGITVQWVHKPTKRHVDQ